MSSRKNKIKYLKNQDLWSSIHHSAAYFKLQGCDCLLLPKCDCLGKPRCDRLVFYFFYFSILSPVSTPNSHQDSFFSNLKTLKHQSLLKNPSRTHQEI